MDEIQNGNIKNININSAFMAMYCQVAMGEIWA
jgi:hypothetical protein